MVLFSGDVFSPSILSTFTHGKQMLPVLNKLGVHTACIGNHDFDFGMETMSELIGQTNFPWLTANVLDNRTNKPLGGMGTSRLVEFQGYKVVRPPWRRRRSVGNACGTVGP